MVLIDEIEIVKVSQDQAIIMNLINGNADLVDIDVANNMMNNNLTEIPVEILGKMKERSYIFETFDDKEEFIRTVDVKLLEDAKDETPNFIYLPTFSCNLDCYYCFEKAYEKNNAGQVELNQDVNKIFETIENLIRHSERRNNRIYNRKSVLVTLTGGEPLLIRNKDVISNIFSKCNEKGYKIAIVTNGTTLDYYEDIIKKANVESIQVTIDGSREIHDSIRKTKTGEGTFDVILENAKRIKKYVKNVVVRINVNKKNIDSIDEIYDLSKAYKDIEFYTFIMQQEGCCDNQNVLKETDALKRMERLIFKEDECKNFDIGYHGKAIVEGIFSGKEFNPKIKICAAMQNQYIVDHFGGIYKCWWGMGNKDYLIGKMSDRNEKAFIDEDREKIYLQRNIYGIIKCKKCKYRYVCGGGCSGRLQRSDLKRGEVICPDFPRIFNYVVSKKFEMRESN